MECGLREVVTPPMSEQRPTRDSMSIEEATVSNMWEITAIHARKSTDRNGVREEED
jgi:hypothetical protein